MCFFLLNAMARHLPLHVKKKNGRGDTRKEQKERSRMQAFHEDMGLELSFTFTGYLIEWAEY
jgi:hypothetical protein